MYYYDGPQGSFGWGHAIFGGIMMLLVWGVIIAGIVWVVRSLTHGRQQAPQLPATYSAPRSSAAARDILDQRFARGEIGDDEYKRMRAILDGTDTP